MDNIYYIFSKYYHSIINNCGSKNIEDLMVKKLIHTFRVINNSKEIGLSLGLSRDLMLQIEIASLFHDIGRFEQALQFGHFKDSKSFNHAGKSVEIFLLFKDEILEIITETAFENILKAIKYHNRLCLPEGLSRDIYIISNVIRDADKLNILSINLKSNFISFDGTLSLNEEINTECEREFMTGRVVSTKNVHTVLDNRIKLLSWIYDFNYKISLDIFKSEGYIEILTNDNDIKCAEIKRKLFKLKNQAEEYIDLH